jgi:hypothetical protein
MPRKTSQPTPPHSTSQSTSTPSDRPSRSNSPDKPDRSNSVRLDVPAHPTPSTGGLWSHHELEIVVDRLVGGIPGSDNLLDPWMRVNGAPAEAKAEQEAARANLDETAALHSVVFMRDGNGQPVYESRCMKAALKEGANVLNKMLQRTAFRAKLAERVFVGPKLVPITSPIQSEEKPISVMTMQGPRTSLKRYEYADDVRLNFSLRILQDGVIKPEDVATILEYLQENGIGSDRSQGAGTFQLVRFAPA